MTPGDPVAITRGARVQFRAVVERIAWPGGDVILTDVRRLDGRVHQNVVVGGRPVDGDYRAPQRPQSLGRMTPGARAIITRRDRVEFFATVERIAGACRDVVLVDVRNTSGRRMMTTGFRCAMPLVLRAKGRVGAGGYGGELKAEADEWDH